MSNVLLLAAILPALFIIYKVYQQDRLEKEPVGLMAVLIVMGILSAFGAIVLEYVGEWILDGFVSYYRPIYNVIYYFVIIAGSEEIMKYVFLKLNKVSFLLSSIVLLFEIFISIPITAKNTIKLLPPAEINGNGIPVGGIEPVTTATLIRVWQSII